MKYNQIGYELHQFIKEFIIGMKAEGNVGVDEKLIDAAAALNLDDVTRLIK